MAHPNKTKQKAFKLWVQGMSVLKVSKEIGVSEKSIHDWKHANDWVKRRKKIQERTAKKVIEKLSDMEIRHITQAQTIQTKGIKGVEKGTIKLKAKDIIDAAEFERLTRGESTEKVEVSMPEVIKGLFKEKKKKDDEEEEEVKKK